MPRSTAIQKLYKTTKADEINIEKLWGKVGSISVMATLLPFNNFTIKTILEKRGIKIKRFKQSIPSVSRRALELDFD